LLCRLHAGPTPIHAQETVVAAEHLVGLDHYCTWSIGDADVLKSPYIVGVENLLSRFP